jgi:hypothetical protein
MPALHGTGPELSPAVLLHSGPLQHPQLHGEGPDYEPEDHEGKHPGRVFRFQVDKLVISNCNTYILFSRPKKTYTQYIYGSGQRYALVFPCPSILTGDVNPPQL